MGLAFLLAIQVLAGSFCQAEDVVAEVRPPSKWVTPLIFRRPPQDDAADPSLNCRWLLSDRQINARNDEQFIHEARLTLTSAGVQDASHILIHYDPACQSLTFHWARIWRGTNKLDRLDPSQLRLNPAGLEAAQFLFNSKREAVLPLEDVRVGDIVDYAYSIEGSSPALNGKFFGAVPLQFPEPVDREVTRLVWPVSRLLYITNHLTDIQPLKVRKSNTVELTWIVNNEPALRLEPMTPVWYDPYPWVQLSEWQRWSDVNRWALRLFTATNAPSPELARKISDWKKLPEPSARVLAALRFVQEEVRNVGQKDGDAGYAPVAPSVVFARRLGDCEDKTLLLVTVLRALKIEACPVLVNARLRRDLAALRPSPILFDHAVVQVNLDGRSYWLDATGNYERGPLWLRSWPNYGLGLKVAPGVTALTLIPLCPVQPSTAVTNYFSLAAPGEESTVKIVTVAEGRDADLLRARFATTARDDIERENFNDYARFYPFIRRTGPLLYSDDEQQNRIEITESYGIRRMWTLLADRSDYNARIYSVNVDEALIKPAATDRAMPLALPYPVHEIFHAEVDVSSGYPFDPSNVRIENPTFFFQRTASYAVGKLVLNYEYRSWTDAVAPEALRAYLRELDTATEALGYTLLGF